MMFRFFVGASILIALCSLGCQIPDGTNNDTNNKLGDQGVYSLANLVISDSLAIYSDSNQLKKIVNNNTLRTVTRALTDVTETLLSNVINYEVIDGYLLVNVGDTLVTLTGGSIYQTASAGLYIVRISDDKTWFALGYSFGQIDGIVGNNIYYTNGGGGYRINLDTGTLTTLYPPEQGLKAIYLGIDGSIYYQQQTDYDEFHNNRFYNGNFKGPDGFLYRLKIDSNYTESYEKLINTTSSGDSWSPITTNPFYFHNSPSSGAVYLSPASLYFININGELLTIQPNYSGDSYALIKLLFEENSITFSYVKENIILSSLGNYANYRLSGNSTNLLINDTDEFKLFIIPIDSSSPATQILPELNVYSAILSNDNLVTISAWDFSQSSYVVGVYDLNTQTWISKDIIGTTFQITNIN